MPSFMNFVITMHASLKTHSLCINELKSSTSAEVNLISIQKNEMDAKNPLAREITFEVRDKRAAMATTSCFTAMVAADSTHKNHICTC